MKILIVDDDPNAIQTIKDTILWAEYGIEQVYTAYHGVQALELVEEYEPDIIISDIEMPQMDGVQMLKELSLFDNHPEVIFLTCHDSFSYVQKALQYGASNYLLKPLKKDELIGALLNVIVKCQKKREEIGVREKLALREKQAEKNQDYLIQNLINQLLNKTIEGSTERLDIEIAQRNVLFEVSERYYLIYAGVNMNSNEIKEITESEFYFIFRNLSTETIYGNVNVNCVVENTVYPYYILVMPVWESMGDEKYIQESCRRLITAAERYLGITLLCVVSSPIPADEFGNTKKRMDKLYLRERTEHSKIIMLEEKSRAGEVEGIVIQKKVLQCLRERKKTELIKTAKRFLQQLDRENNLNTIHMQAFHHDIIQLFYGFLLENHIQAYQLFQNEIFRRLNEEAEYSTVNMIKYISYLYDLTFKQIDILKESDSVITRVKKYIKEHFRENISREDIAASIFLTPNYFSKVFHEETGMALREYINLCRIEEAKRLLSSTDYSVTDIALLVGFENIPYFSTVFKRYCNMTPAAWKATLENK